MSAETIKKIKRSGLTQDDRIDIATRLQLDALDLVNQANSIGGGVVFHGGTSIAFVHGSPRWSEDLDFMATPEAVSRIFSHAGRMESMLQLKSSVAHPGATVQVNRKKGGEGQIGEVAKLNIRWEHPDLIGAIKIKVEFYTCPGDRLSVYGDHLAEIGLRGKRLRSPVRSATLESVWADKILAMALRPALKFRDIHDLGFIAPRLADGFDREAYITASMGIYDKAADDVARGLDRSVVTDHIHDKDAFFADMERWFEPEKFDLMKSKGILDARHEGFLDQLEIAREVVTEMTNTAGLSL